LSERTVHTRWDGGMRAVTEANGFQIIVDEPESAGGNNTGPQPTDLFLASISSCFAVSMAWVARKHDITLSNLTVDAVGRYDGPKFVQVTVAVKADNPRPVLEELAKHAQRVCYVTNTLRRGPEITLTIG
jgi:organic hydroperoxide reductase OsmC/OhrA